ncbi:DUF2023 family protein [Chrysiogenes arsenatis]|uniref:DUF2023 family protein n=1 Tax=Chrysiogenes arsenatis TaxID=309797 RepID=UPI00041764BF|nr:DUF2023 family protein [Chrysiogenes arsenatis]
MKVFCHHIYEYRKGLRSLILHTMSTQLRSQVEAQLQRHKIDFLIYDLAPNRMNVFFGAPECIDVLRRIGKSSLNDYTCEEDFILGTMLGYDRLQQCQRYLQRTERQTALSEVSA